MSLARYLSKLGAFLGSDGKVPAAALAAGAARANFGAGAVLQVVSAQYSTMESYTNTSSWQASGLTATITPTSLNSKILVLVSVNSYMGSPSIYNTFALFRNSAVNLSTNNYGFGEIYGNTGDRFGCVSHSFLDSPATLSPVTYTVFRKVTGGTGYINLNSENSSITLLEIAA